MSKCPDLDWLDSKFRTTFLVLAIKGWICDDLVSVFFLFYVTIVKE
jgi:hypothetical protein